MVYFYRDKRLFVVKNDYKKVLFELPVFKPLRIKKRPRCRGRSGCYTSRGLVGAGVNVCTVITLEGVAAAHFLGTEYATPVATFIGGAVFLFAGDRVE